MLIQWKTNAHGLIKGKPSGFLFSLLNRVNIMDNQKALLDKEIKSIEARRKKLFALKKPIEVELGTTYDKLEALKSERDNLVINEGWSTAEEEMQFYLFEDGLVSGERYKKRSKYWDDKGLWHTGYRPEVNQVALKVMLYQDGRNFDLTLNSVKELIPHLTSIKSVDAKVIGIFEHNLSENGSFELRIKDDDGGYQYQIVRSYYRVESVEAIYKDLESALKYIQEHLNYEEEE